MSASAGGCEPSQEDAISSEALTNIMQNAGHNQPSKSNTVQDSDPGMNDASSQRRASKIGALTLSASERRSRFHRQFQTSESKSSSDACEKGSLTPAMRKRYLKDLFLNQNSHSGLSSILSLKSASRGTPNWNDAPYEDSSALWALDPTEHAWMLSVVDGNLDTMVEFLAEDPDLLVRKDFISGYTVLHWLAKSGRHETLIQLLKHAERKGYPVNINLKGSGGLTPLHIAAMHSQFMVMKVLVGAFGASLDVMDYNGKRAWQYLKEDAPPEMKELLGAWDDEHTHWQMNMNNNCACRAQAPSEWEPQIGTDVVELNSSEQGWMRMFQKFTSFLFGERNKGI